MSGERVFVYGTLRPGQPAHDLVAPSIARLESATTSGLLYALGDGYPGYASGAGMVHGEVIWLTDPAATLRRLDDYEGEEFTRVVCTVALQSGLEVTAWIYAFTDSAALRRQAVIESGDWIVHLAQVGGPR